MRTFLKITSALVLTIFVLISSPSETRACGDVFHDVVFEPGPRWTEVAHEFIQGVTLAERDLKAERASAAGGAILRMIPDIRRFEKLSRTGSPIFPDDMASRAVPDAREMADYPQSINKNDQALNRALRVFALAVVRNEGVLPLRQGSLRTKSWDWADKRHQVVNARWAANILEEIAKGALDDPIAQSEFAEALAQLPDRCDEGHALLEGLAQKDLLPTAEAYRSLATLRGDAGDGPRKLAALERCRLMALDSEGTCSRQAPSAQTPLSVHRSYRATKISMR